MPADTKQKMTDAQRKTWDEIERSSQTQYVTRSFEVLEDDDDFSHVYGDRPFDADLLRRHIASIRAEADKHAENPDVAMRAGSWDQGVWFTLLDEDGKRVNPEATYSYDLGFSVFDTPISSLVDCGTACCLAGNVLHEQKVVWVNQDSAILPDGNVAAADAYGRWALGIDSDAADRLFEGHNNVADLERISEQIIRDGGIYVDHSLDED